MNIMAESGMTAYVDAAGVAISPAMVLFVLRKKNHPEELG
ncbi:hypothetical protein AAA799B03_01324 [Marine Group I thaumarchaeote SCGC AAA799-B03]|uniref:Uncharacterized protein n=3 Tax=Marine Group I TaxID=905826 RepID=A0A087S5Z9_9ARCH|nr:hypothetical protein AAA799N04_00414 [Marine Group I thaumarchaeote SCGC AAA799-N04]KFM19193.1 hypothetical protein SCCGRSA3_00778 [Marine Group I thaumarchaeote SCGC RSA3]KFM21153.1 hypothetical protein AAA799B03_01324 [Marine Group I thaumarchaeote SCGC AAA799-B03]